MLKLQRISIVCRIILILGLLALPGCRGGQYGEQEVIPVRGVVTYQGQPVEGADVAFEPIGATAPGGFGRTDARGRFRLQTFGPNDGVVPGDHAVTIRKVELAFADPDAPGYDPENPPPLPPPKHVLPEGYANAATSGLKATVTAEGPREFTFDLE